MSVISYGDSHGDFSFRGCDFPFINLSNPATTMHNIGESGAVPNWNLDICKEDSIVCFSYGEIDCRVHVKTQMERGREEDEIIEDLVRKYFATISTLAMDIKYKKIVIIGVEPPIYYSENSVTKDWCNGTSEERRRFITKLNKLCKGFCEIYSYTYFEPYDEYTLEDGSIKTVLSDGICHIRDTTIFLKKFNEAIH
jgi:hypothetical protein